MPKHYKDGSLSLPKDAVIEKLALPELESGKFERTYKDLFPNLPCATDVVQGQMGNCGFMASVMMLAKRDDAADLIQGMMKDMTMGKVVVRVYDMTNQPHYVQIAKKIPRDDDGDPVSSTGAIWVRMLESAYVSFKKLTFKQMTGVHPEVILQMFMGPDAGQSQNLKVLNSAALFEILVDIFYLDKNTKKLPSSRGAEVGKPENQQKLKTEVFGDNDEYFHRWVLWNSHIKDKQLDFTRYRQNQKIHVTRRADFDEWWDSLGARTNALPHEVSKAVLDWLNNANVLPGKRFTGRYSLEQLSLYAAIDDALTHKQIVNASTMTNFYRKAVKSGETVEDGTKGKAGEESRQGMFAKHWYGVVSVEKDEGNIRFITLRNPHGETGRAYNSSNKPVAVEGRAGVESRLEFSDFTKLADEVVINGRRVTGAILTGAV